MPKTKPSLINEVNKIPSYLDVPTGVFKDIEHYRKVVSGITKALARGKRKSQNSKQSYLFDGLEIEFRKDIQYESVFLDQINSKY